MTQVKSTKILTNEFVSQLLAYSRGEYPFLNSVGERSVLEWWTELGMDPRARTLVLIFCDYELLLLTNLSMLSSILGKKLTQHLQTQWWMSAQAFDLQVGITPHFRTIRKFQRPPVSFTVFNYIS